MYAAWFWVSLAAYPLKFRQNDTEIAFFIIFKHNAKIYFLNNLLSNLPTCISFMYKVVKFR